ncbi:PREDICTED: uncharacterized protein LOC104606172 [Nelumbo nucifera]|uniref:RING-type domain-containing protein n=2 Tax=Nelumbo nucifera TaxID=4432 RepID=A0A822YGH5_NELNU|nr:PREDICTED: uncharacterized protein LOC104606172 [Nelumbo nucifera]DAD33294.1 TPA_asm: hypothetical protein HUJ06_012145 [Nelumbo nucifera]
MGSEDADLLDDGGGGGLSLGASSVSCSICLEAVTDNGDRSRAKLQCGHEFHLDCIGSAFNAKGMMQCPNCRKIEKGQWLYANGCRSFAEFSMDDWTHDEDLYDLSYSEMPFGVHWCPFSGLARVPSSFEEGESPSTAYHDLLGHHAIFADHTAASSAAAHSCPYVAYFQPLQPSTSSSNESIGDGPNFNHHWNSLSGPSDMSVSHGLPTVDIQYHSWDHHSPPFSPTSSRMAGADQASVHSSTLRSTRGDTEGLPRSGSFVHPFLLGHGSGPRAGSSVVSLIPPYSGSSARAHDRVQGLHAYHQQQQSSSTPGMRGPIFSGVRRSSGPRGLAPVGPLASSSDHTGAFYVFPPSGSSSRNLQEAENPVRSRFYAWERDRFAPFPLIPVDRESSWWGPFHQAAGGSDSGSRTSSFWQRHGSERSSQGRAENSSYQPVHPTGRMFPFI